MEPLTENGEYCKSRGVGGMKRKDIVYVVGGSLNADRGITRFYFTCAVQYP